MMSLPLRILRPAVRAPCRAIRAQRWRGYATVEVPASKLSFGQPLHETHPHLLKPGESATTCTCLDDRLLNNDAVTPNITALEYYNRRQKLADQLLPNSVAILAGSELKYASGAVFYKFHQDPDFLYLTGTCHMTQTMGAG